jgi:hypothetical protein
MKMLQSEFSVQNKARELRRRSKTPCKSPSKRLEASSISPGKSTQGMQGEQFSLKNSANAKTFKRLQRKGPLASVIKDVEKK